MDNADFQNNYCCCCGHGGFDIIDHAFGKSFPSSLLEELQENGIIGALKPARTKLDVDLADVMQKSFFGNDYYNNTSISHEKNDNDTTSNLSTDRRGSSIRGDISAFLPRHVRRQDSFPTQYPHLHKLISSIEHTVVGSSSNGKQTISHESSSPIKRSNIYFEIDTNLTSVQIAKYAGDGMAGYPRHCDRGVACRHESSLSNGHDSHSAQNSNGRIVTFVYYLTPEDWDQELDGGALRMFSPMIGEDPTPNHDDSSNRDLYFDIVPYADRLVVFRSDLMEHQVLPSLRRDRIAITVWLYGKVVLTRPNNELDLQQTAALPFDYPPTETDSSLPPPLPVVLSTDDEEEKSIFVAIPSYRDEETWPTIKSLIEMACRPKRVYIGVVFQVDTASEEETKRFTSVAGCGVTIQSSLWSQSLNFRSIIMDYRHSTGEDYGYVSSKVV